MRLSKGIEKVEDFTIAKTTLAKDGLKKQIQKIKNTKHKGKIGLISGVLLTMLITGKGCQLVKTDEPVKTTDDNLNKIMENAEQELAQHLSFDPNSEKELINRIADTYVDAAAKGLGDLTIEQWMDWYTVTNIDDISPVEYYKLLDDTKTATTIMENYDFVNNALLEDAITATSETIIDIENLVADTKSADELADFQKLLATYNTASADTKKQIANQINEYLFDEFVTSKHKTVTASSNLTRMKLLLATWELTNNHSWTVPSEDISKIIYPSDNANCELAKESTGISVWNDQKVIVRKTVEEKMEMMNRFMLYEDKTQQDVRVALRSLEIEMAIQKLIDEKGLVIVANPSSEQAIIDSKPKTSKGKTITKEQEKYIVKNPKTGEKEVVLPPKGTTENKELLEDVRKKNQNEELRVKGVQEGAQAGNDNGYADGSANKTFNDKPRINLSSYDKIYSDAYTSNYKKYYSEAYEEGKKLAAGPINKKEEVKPDEKVNQEIVDLMIKSGKENGYAAGDQQGWNDGFGNKTFNSNVTINHEDKNYVDAYTNEYKSAYKNAYSDGESARLEQSKQVTPTATPAPTPTPTPTPKPTEAPKLEDKVIEHEDGSKTTEEIELLPGFYEKDGKIYDEDGNEVEVIASAETNQNLAALKTLRSALSNIYNENEIEPEKTRFL